MMRPDPLYTLDPDAPDVPPGLHLVAGLTGFADAGGAVAQTVSAVLDGLDARLIAEFDADALLDYRARRPVITFDEDRVTEVSTPRLTLHLVQDELGGPFLLLSGYEPDFQWNRFVRVVSDVVASLEVESTTWLQAIPLPVPHTRPIALTVSGTRHDLIESMSAWRPKTQAPANVLHLVERALVADGRSVTGFVLLVPHYLADTEYPAVAVAALSAVSSATGLIFPTDVLRDAGRAFQARVDEQVAGNPELQQLVKALEERHDAYMEGNSVVSPLVGADGTVPTADSIADELERFLAERWDDADEG